MKKILSILLMLALLLSSATALAGDDKGAKYTMSTKNVVVLQNSADRKITPSADALDVNPLIEGESPTTGLPYDTKALYLPMLVQISNPTDSVKIDGKKVTAAGIGNRTPWGGQYADVVYEGILYRSGETRITFMYSDGRPACKRRSRAFCPYRSCAAA